MPAVTSHSAARVVSLVPSWTETLLRAGVAVKGRTRFCIHPQDQIKVIAVVGGTKDIQWQRVQACQADLLILDREENPRWMGEQSPLPWCATHVQNVSDLPLALQTLHDAIGGTTKLLEFASRWESVLTSGFQKSVSLLPVDHSTELGWPGIIEWWSRPRTPPLQVLYMIWKNPWMVISRQTFIGSMLEFCGYGKLLPEFGEKYPKIQLTDYPPDSTLLLFSSEPFPFAKQRAELEALGYPCALVSGEQFGWFGLRALEFLEGLIAQNKSAENV